VNEVAANFLDRTECPACGGTAPTTLALHGYSEPRMRAFLREYYGLDESSLEVLGSSDYWLLRCGHCGLVYQRLAPIGGLAEKLYGEWLEPVKAQFNQSHGHSVEGHARLTEEIGAVLNQLRLSPHETTVLDVGMGWGEWCLVARAYGCRVYGLELSAPCLSYARELGIDTISWGDVGHERFDFINVAQVLEHLPMPATALRSLVEALKPGGLMRVAVPDGSRVGNVVKNLDWDLGGVADRRFMLVHPLEHVNCYETRSLDTLAARVGLRPARPSVWNETVVIERLRLKPLLTALARPIYRRLRPAPPDHWYRRGTRQR
jgi:SAM-dependent methyltransferase